MGIFDFLFKKKPRYRFVEELYNGRIIWSAEEHWMFGMYTYVSGTLGNSLTETKHLLKKKVSFESQEPIYWDGKD